MLPGQQENLIHIRHWLEILFLLVYSMLRVFVSEFQ